ncbi:MAG TPA: ShlB/FhaC/HecB family hemolysin secretion/activation protein [Roseococcus sp.]|jgi:hemolysin activation/secretion protein|nr:ShlB/FhaC/HecB family hemolysin secretion/activation protein [Roseococcus sp.]
MAAVVAALPFVAQAQPAPPAIAPQEVLRDIAPPAPPRLSPGLQAPAITATPIAPGAPDVRIGRVTLLGHETLPAARLERHVAALANRQVSQAEIEAARIAVLTEYRQAGYPFISVAITGEPAAEGFDLRVTVREGRIARVRLSQDIGPAGVQVLRFLQGAVSEGAASVARIERALLLAGDVPGVTVRGVLRPLEGGAAGELELLADVSRRPVSGLLTVDNRGFRLTGPVQFLALAQGNSFTSLGERTEAAFFTSAEAESLFGQATTEFFLGGSGLRVRLYAGAGRTTPSGPLAEIGYAGFTTTAGVALSYPVIRSRAANLTVGAQFDIFDNTVDTGAAPAVRASHDSLRVLRAGFDGNFRDTLLSFAPAAATTQGLVRLHQGIAALGATRAGSLPGPSRRGSDAGFTKISGELTRTQPLLAINENAVFSLQGTLAGQWSDDVLPAAEKYFLGGNRIGRGFYTGQVSGDRAVAIALEAQLDLRLPNFTLEFTPGQPTEIRHNAQFYIFYDAGRTYENLPTDPGRRVESFGGGIRTVFNDVFHFDIEAVHRITRRVDAGGAAVPPLAATAGYARALMRF